MTFFRKILNIGEDTSKVVGVAAMAWHIFGALRGQEPPEDNEHAKVARILYGGLFSSEDEKVMRKVEKLLTPEELKTLKANRIWIRKNFGNGAVGWLTNWIFQNRFRVHIANEAKPEKVSEVKHFKQVKGKDVLDRVDQVITPADYTDAANLLKAYIAEIDRTRTTTTGTQEQKDEAGFQAGVEWLRDEGVPAPFFSKGITTIDEFVTHLPTRAVAAGSSIINNLEQRGANRSKKSWWRKWL